MVRSDLTAPPDDDHLSGAHGDGHIRLRQRQPADLGHGLEQQDHELHLDNADQMTALVSLLFEAALSELGEGAGIIHGAGDELLEDGAAGRSDRAHPLPHGSVRTQGSDGRKDGHPGRDRGAD